MFVFIPVIYGMIRFRTFSLDLRIFYVYLFLVMLEWSVATIYAFMGKNNHFLLNIFLMIELALPLWVFSLWQKNARIQFIIRITIIVFVFILIAEIFVLNDINNFTKYSGPLENVILIIVSALTLYEINKNTEVILTDQPRFWISSGILLYSSGALVLTNLSQWLLRNNPDLLRNALIIESAASSVAYIFYFMGFRCHYKMQKSGGS